MKSAFFCAAEGEYSDTVAWYHERSPRAAVRFEAEIERALEDIASAPQRWPLIRPGVRIRHVSGFPMTIVYRIVGEIIEVVAFAHTSRLPGYWQERIEEPDGGAAE